jgi:3-oxoacyl-[acyl-carrier-protein] synthase II
MRALLRSPAGARLLWELGAGRPTVEGAEAGGTKIVLVETLGASGAVETIFCTLAIHEGVLPPTINY